MKDPEQLTIEQPTAPLNQQQTNCEPAAMTAQESDSASILATITRISQSGIDLPAMRELWAMHKEAKAIEAERLFNEGLAECQAEIQLVVNDTQGQKKKFASYKALDKEVRPIYLKRDFSLSFGSADCATPNFILVTCLMSRGAYTRTYQLPMDASGLGPKGEGALSKPHAILAAMEYGRRCLLKSIFNIVTGDEGDLTEDEGQVDKGWLTSQLEELGRCQTLDGLNAAFRSAGKTALDTQDIEAYRALNKAKNVRKKELQKEAANVR